LLICETQAINNLKPLFSIIKQALMFRSYFTLILSFCLAAIICAGQPNQYFKKIDNKQGLSQNGIFAIKSV
jgi:hypothetical protein